MARGYIELKKPIPENAKHILTPEALGFVADMAEHFAWARGRILADREEQSAAYRAGTLPGFNPATQHIRDAKWSVAPAPEDLVDRRVEITGPTGDTKMVINAFNSGANVYMSDFEDSQSPTWDNVVQGQVNLYDAVRRQLTYTSPEGKHYALNEHIATLIVRPRGWHLEEKHLLVDGKPIPAALFDFGIFFFNNAQELLHRGSGPYFYLPKLESAVEAQLWERVFLFAQDAMRVPRGSIRATVLIETLPAAFEMEEILFALKNHSAGLNCGRWDYIFSFIKTLGHDPTYLLPDRGQVTMDKAFLAAYAKLLVQTCHKRGAHAMGGMAAQIPIKGDKKANKAAMKKVRADKLREVKLGHDGTWVAHPGLIGLAKEIFDKHMPQPNQMHVIPKGTVTEADLLEVPKGVITEEGLRANLRISVLYVEPWLRGIGCVPIENLMEDAATAEISRTQVWQWLTHGATLQDGGSVSPSRVTRILDEELDAIAESLGAAAFAAGCYNNAANLVEKLILTDACASFLTIPAYEQLITDKEEA